MNNLFHSKSFLVALILAGLLLGGDEAVSRVQDNLNIDVDQVLNIMIATGFISTTAYSRAKGDETIYTPRFCPGRNKPPVVFDDYDKVDESELF